MVNEIIEKYKILEEKIKTQEAKHYFDMLESPYASFKSKAIQELTKLNIETPLIKDFIEDTDTNVRYSALKYLIKMGETDEKIIKTCIKDISSSIRKESIVSLVNSGYEQPEELIKLTDDPDPVVRYSLLVSFLEYYPEDYEKIILKLSKDPNLKIQQLITSLENFSDTLKSNEIDKTVKKVSLIRFLETNDSLTFFNTIKEVYSECNQETKSLIIKFLSALPCEIIKSFLENKISEEKQEEILYELSKTIKKACSIEDIPEWLIEKFINSNNPKILDQGLKLATEKEEMGYVDFARQLLEEIDDNLVIAGASYLLAFDDYKLTDYIDKFLNSLSSKRINIGLKIIKKLKLENYAEIVAKISENKIYPVSVRKNSLNIMKIFKSKEYWEIPFQILKDAQESSKLKITALNVLLRLNPEMVSNI